VVNASWIMSWPLLSVWSVVKFTQGQARQQLRSP